MDLLEVDLLGDAIDSHWYYQSKARALLAILGRGEHEAVLDVGAGSGFFAKYLLAESSIKAAWCVDPAYPSDCDVCYAGKPLYFRRTIDACPADLVLMMDVLEHVDDDLALVNRYEAVLTASERRNQTTWVISVPAFAWMWSGHDVFLGHKRRYHQPQLAALFRRPGWRIDTLCFYFALVFPLAWLSRMLRRWRGVKGSQLQVHSRWVNALLTALCWFEIGFFRLNRWFGLTLFCRATRSATTDTAPPTKSR